MSRDRRDDAVRVVLGEVLAGLAAARGLPVPPGALAPRAPADPALVAALRSTVRRPADDSVEQLGYAYESLLDATERRHAGAHYTPVALAEEVVAHALGPLVEGRDPVALTDLRIADIAAGSGVFLIAAARFLADRGAPLAEVAARCLHGADVDATAVEICRLSLWLLAADPDLSPGGLGRHVVQGDSLLDVPVDGRRPVAWGLDPRAGFDAVIGNPPFLGVKRIRDAFGREVRDHYARTLLEGRSGRSDLVVFFLARAAQLARAEIALVLPGAVTEGDTARYGIDRLVAHGWSVRHTGPSRPWPGAAGVRIRVVSLERTAAAAPAPTAPPARRTRPGWLPHGYQATIVLGRSLLLTPAEADAMRAEDPRAARWIRPYLSGDDVVSTVGPAARRQVLDLGRASLEELRAVPPVARRLVEVESERARQVDRYPQLRARWWGFLNPVDRLYDELDGLDEAIAFAKHAKYVWPVLVPTGAVVSNGAIVYPTADRAAYGFLASLPHRLWATRQGGSRLNQSHRYNPSRLLATYPFPDDVAGLRAPGERLARAVAAACTSLEVGVTEALNRVHGVGADEHVAQVRAAIVDVDRAALAAHGLEVPLEHVVRETPAGTRFGVGEDAEDVVLAALADLAGTAPAAHRGG